MSTNKWDLLDKEHYIGSGIYAKFYPTCSCIFLTEQLTGKKIMIDFGSVSILQNLTEEVREKFL